jgi:hypothetical protein
MKAEWSHIKVAVPFIWAGCIGAISFMEAWLKFTAPGVTLATGLSIGKVVFAALNKVEVVFAMLIAIALLLSKTILWKAEILLFVSVVVLIIQSVWILPVLDQRVDLYLKGITPPASNMHFCFITLESIKLVSLLSYGFKQLTLWKISHH